MCSASHRLSHLVLLGVVHTRQAEAGALVEVAELLGWLQKPGRPLLTARTVAQLQHSPVSPRVLVLTSWLARLKLSTVRQMLVAAKLNVS